ncbi:hypothetical protein [Clostridium saccharoperbutylacetonicum]|uniref:hypothetical protein n=1 Tax=Clostridium saccharoperbutylacetonicum TaxID=36745 RepID=UPI0039ECCA8F
MGKIKRWIFGFKELKYFLFNRKICKICGFKMKKVTNEKYVGMEKFYGITGLSYDKAYEITISYYCQKCNKEYSLEELSDRKE